MTRRLDLAQRFLDRRGWQGAELSPLAGDASFRRYYRVASRQGPAVLMDAPPEHEDPHAFLAISGLLAERGFSSPRIIAADCDEGFILLEDLGDDKFTALLDKGRADETTLYDAAVDLLVALQADAPPAILKVEGEDPYDFPAYGTDDLLEEVSLFVDWYLPAIQQPLSDQGRQEYFDLWRGLLAEPAACEDVIVLRDYHADNLIWLPDREGSRRVGLLDYQDARRSHAAYDLVSLLQDARRDVSADLERQAIRRYLAQSRAAGQLDDSEAFLKIYALLGAQRNAKIIGIFTRLSRRDGKHSYLNLIPRVWELFERDLEHPGLVELARWFNDRLAPAARQQPVPPIEAAEAQP